MALEQCRSRRARCQGSDITTQLSDPPRTYDRDVHASITTTGAIGKSTITCGVLGESQ